MSDLSSKEIVETFLKETIMKKIKIKERIKKEKKQFLVDVGSRMKITRTMKGLKQKYVAERAHMHPVTLANIEAGRQQTTLEGLRDIAQALGVTMSYLLGEEAPKNGIQAQIDALKNEIRGLKK